jgi:hypothetical protein
LLGDCNAETTDKEIAARAYKLSEEAGMPKDRDQEFWHQAEQRWRAEISISTLGNARAAYVATTGRHRRRAPDQNALLAVQCGNALGVFSAT